MHRQDLKRFVFKRKIPDSFTKSLKTAISTICYNPKNAILVGSGSTKSMIYASDFDLAELFHSSLADIAKAMQSIIRKILDAGEGYYFADCKCGYDKRFDVFHNLGKVQYTSIVDFDPVKTRQQLESVKGLMDSETYGEIRDLINKASHPENASAWLDLRECIRHLLTVRWTPEEVLHGSKLVGGQTLTLEEAIPRFMTKIDMWFNYDGVITEITNVILTPLSEKLGLVFFPTSAKESEFEEAIKYNVFEHLYASEKNYLKAIKRVYSLAKTGHDNSMLQKIAPLLTSNINLLSKASSVLGALVDMLEKLPRPPMKLIKQNIEQTKTMLANIYAFDFKEKSIDQMLTNAQKVDNKDELAHRLEVLRSVMARFINDQTLKYAKDNFIFPLPRRYFP